MNTRLENKSERKEGGVLKKAKEETLRKKSSIYQDNVSTKTENDIVNIRKMLISESSPKVISHDQSSYLNKIKASASSTIEENRTKRSNHKSNENPQETQEKLDDSIIKDYGEFATLSINQNLSPIKNQMLNKIDRPTISFPQNIKPIQQPFIPNYQYMINSHYQNLGNPQYNYIPNIPIAQNNQQYIQNTFQSRIPVDVEQIFESPQVQEIQQSKLNTDQAKSQDFNKKRISDNDKIVPIELDMNENDYIDENNRSDNPNVLINLDEDQIEPPTNTEQNYEIINDDADQNQFQLARLPVNYNQEFVENDPTHIKKLRKASNFEYNNQIYNVKNLGEEKEEDESFIIFGAEDDLNKSNLDNRISEIIVSKM